MPMSEVLSFRQRLTLEEQSAKQGLSGIAITASHEFITARMERMAEYLNMLTNQGKHEEARALFLSDDPWNVVDEEEKART